MNVDLQKEEFNQSVSVSNISIYIYRYIYLYRFCVLHFISLSLPCFEQMIWNRPKNSCRHTHLLITPAVATLTCLLHQLSTHWPAYYTTCHLLVTSAVATLACLLHHLSPHSPAYYTSWCLLLHQLLLHCCYILSGLNFLTSVSIKKYLLTVCTIIIIYLPDIHRYSCFDKYYMICFHIYAAFVFNMFCLNLYEIFIIN